MATTRLISLMPGNPEFGKQVGPTRSGNRFKGTLVVPSSAPAHVAPRPSRIDLAPQTLRPQTSKGSAWGNSIHAAMRRAPRSVSMSVTSASESTSRTAMSPQQVNGLGENELFFNREIAPGYLSGAPEDSSMLFALGCFAAAAVGLIYLKTK